MSVRNSRIKKGGLVLSEASKLRSKNKKLEERIEELEKQLLLHNVSNSNAYIKELEKIDKIHWARIYCELNGWNMPKELIQLKPKWWKDGVVDRKKSDIIRPVNNHIVLIIGDRWVSREWNKERMTEEEHNRWWIDTHLT